MKELSQEEKELLLKDLSERLPYQPLCKKIDAEDNFCECDAPLGYSLRDLVDNKIIIKPYLRPMSSMTEEELTELAYKVFQQPDIDIIRRWVFENKLYPSIDGNLVMVIDWLNARHFDYRRLIEKGLAIEAPEGMYNN